MKKSRRTEERIIGASKRPDAAQKASDGNQARRLRELQRENCQLKKLVADLSLDQEALKGVIRKNGWS